jgi:hypothetical protein
MAATDWMVRGSAERHIGINFKIETVESIEVMPRELQAPEMHQMAEASCGASTGCPRIDRGD